jgi:isopentenyldiphosphate isomerase
LKVEEIREVQILPASPRTDYEFIAVFTATTDAPISPDPAEVIATAWQTPAQWRHEIKTAARIFSPTLLHTFECCPELIG